MFDLMRIGSVSGCLIMTVLFGVSVSADELTPQQLFERIPELPAPESNDGSASQPSTASSEDFETYCPPRRQGAFARWRQQYRDHVRDKFWGYPEEFHDVPLGASVAAHASTQIAGGQAAQRVLYHYDFHPMSDRLNVRGNAQLAKIGRQLQLGRCPIFVEPTLDRPDLDEARRISVSRELAIGPIPIASEWVVIGRPGPVGLGGAEALVIDRNRLSLTTSRGIGTGGGSAILSGSTSAGGRGN